MVDFPSLPFDLNAVVEAASANAMGVWTSLIVILVLDTIVGGILLIIVLGLFNRIYGEMLDYKRAFIVVLIANIINLPVITGLLAPFIYAVPFIGIILPVLIWVLLLKLFFEDMSFLHALVVGVVFFLVTMVAMPYLVAIVRSSLGI